MCPLVTQEYWSTHHDTPLSIALSQISLKGESCSGVTLGKGEYIGGGCAIGTPRTGEENPFRTPKILTPRTLNLINTVFGIPEGGPKNVCTSAAKAKLPLVKIYI